MIAGTPDLLCNSRGKGLCRPVSSQLDINGMEYLKFHTQLRFHHSYSQPLVESGQNSYVQPQKIQSNCFVFILLCRACTVFLVSSSVFTLQSALKCTFSHGLAILKKSLINKLLCHLHIFYTFNKARLSVFLLLSVI